MIRKLSLKLFIFTMMTVVLTFAPITKEAQALFDPGSLATQVPNTVASVANKVTTAANKAIKATLQVYKSIKDFFKNLFSRKEAKIPGTKKIKESKVANVKDEASIREAFPKLFFRYPSVDPDEQTAYKHKGRMFFEDTMIEAFTAVRELEKNLLKMDSQIVTAESDYTKADDLNGGLYNKYMIDVTTDQVLSIIQELVAIKSQMTAARAVDGDVDPLYIEEDDK